MKYTVLWKQRAEDELAEIWNTAPDRKAVSTAANAIDVLLGQDPTTQGESRVGATRILFRAPLAVRFYVSEPD